MTKRGIFFGSGRISILIAFAFFAVAGCSVETELHWVETADNLMIALTRYLPFRDANEAVPVALLPGITESRRAFDVDMRHSLARSLARDGFDVWTVEFRGRGLSDIPNGPTPLYGPWSCDDFIHYDTVAAFDYIHDTTGRDLFTLGYSEGGLVMTGYLETEDPGIVRGMIGLAPSVVMGATNEEPISAFPPIQYAMSFLAPFAVILPDDLLIPLHSITSFFWSILVLLDLDEEVNELDVWSLLWNPENMDDRIINELMFKVPWTFTTNEIKQYSAGASYFNRQGTGSFPGSDWEIEHGPFNYARNLSLIDIPALIIAGGGDQMVPEANARFVYDNISSTDRTMRTFSVDNGDSHDYGHLDLSIGLNAPREVYPLISDWLLDRS